MAACRQCFEATRKQIEAQGRFWCPRGCVGPVSIPLARVIITSQRPPNAEVPPFVKAIRAGTKLPPVVVQQLEDGRYEVQDGRHRVLACKRVGATHVLAFVQQRSSAREDGSRLAGMGKPITIAYEPEHACEEGCNCAKDSGYVDLVQQSLAELGSDDPAGDIARNAKYVRGAKRAELEPKQAAAMILAMSRPDEGYQPRYRYEDVAEAAHEYIAVDSRGKKVFGPTDDFREATLHAKRAGGVVKFEMAREESAARDYNSIDSAERAAKIQGWTHVATLADSSRRLYKPFGNQGWTSAELYKKEGRWHIGGPSTEQIYTELPPHAALLGAWEAAAPPPASAAAPAAALEPYTKKVRFHRGTREGTYEAGHGALGREQLARSAVRTDATVGSPGTSSSRRSRLPKPRPRPRCTRWPRSGLVRRRRRPRSLQQPPSARRSSATDAWSGSRTANRPESSSRARRTSGSSPRTSTPGRDTRPSRCSAPT